MSDYLSTEQCDVLLHDRICVRCKTDNEPEAQGSTCSTCTVSPNEEEQRYSTRSLELENVLEENVSHLNNLENVMRKNGKREIVTTTQLENNTPQKQIRLIPPERRDNLALALPPRGSPVKEATEERTEPVSKTDVFTDQLEYHPVLGSGWQGRVVRYESAPDRTHAIKCFDSEFPYNRRWNELDQLRKVVGHPSVVQLLGIVYETPTKRTRPTGYIMRLYEEGSLSEAIYGRNGRPGRHYQYADILQWTIQLSAALQHCHNNGVVHADVNPRNIMMHSDYTKVVLIDFGSSATTIKDEDTFSGTIYYMSPEVMTTGLIRYTPACDVFSLCMTIHEIVHRSLPYPYDLASSMMLVSQICGGRRPEFGDGICPAELRNLLERGWSSAPESRPSLDEVRDFCLTELASNAT